MAITFNHNDQVYVKDGKLGIGTASPAAKLHVQSSTSDGVIVRTSTNVEPFIAIQRNSGSNGVAVLRGIDGGHLYVDTGATGAAQSTKMTITSAGNVGIGTTSPGAKLEVNGDGTNTGGIALREGTNQVHYIYTDGPYQYNTIGSSSPNWRWGQQGGNVKMALNNTGLGIGTTSPAKKLDVRGGYFITSDGGANEEAFVQGGNGYAYFGNYSTGKAAFGNSEDWTTLVADGGNVGIGTTSPNQKLEIRDTAPFLRITSTLNDDVNHGGREYGGIEWYTEEDYGNAPVVTAYVKSIHTRAGANHSNADAGLVFGTSLISSDATATERMRIESMTGNVGIGTTSPTSKLHVSNGFIRVDASANAQGVEIYGRSSDNIGELNFRTNSGAFLGRVDGRGDGLGIWSSTNLPINFKPGNTGTKVVFDNSGNVGIGTTSPGAKLSIISGGKGIHVDKGGHSSTSANLSECRTNYAFAYDTLRNGSTTGFFITNVGTNVPAMQAVDSSNNAQNISIQPYGGNVGIGNTNPGVKLDVRDGTYSNSRRLLVVDNSNTGSLGSIVYDTVLIQQNDAPTLRLYESGETLATTLASDAGVSRLASSGHLAFHANGTHTAAGWTGLGGNETMRITSNKVGIGTTSPSAKLDVRVDAPSTSGSIIYVRNTLADGTNNTFGGISFFSSPGTDYTIGKLNTGSASALAFRNANNGTEYMRITSAGNVGIGTTSPSNKLHIYGGRLVLDNAANAQSAIQFNSAGSEKIVVYRPTSTEDLRIYTPGAADAFTLTQAGNVGIGTTSPGSLLQVGNAGAAPTGLATMTLTGANTAPQISTKPGLYHRHAVGLGVFSDYAISFQVNGSTALSDAMRITNTGNVGIGTTSPTYKLHVDGDIGVNAGDGFIARYDSNENYHGAFRWANLQLGNNGRNRIIAGREATGGYLEFWVNNTNDASVYSTTPDGTLAMKIAADGNVGIGTTSPSQKLHVSSASAVFQLTDTNKTANNSIWIQALSQTSWGIGTANNASSGTKITIADSGNVGIGTTSPISELHVVGSARVVTNDSAGGDTLIGAISGVSNGYRILTNTSNEITYSWNTGDNVQAVTINNNGNVGIGTTSPASTLQVDGQVLISATAPLLDFVDTNSFTDVNDRFRVRAGGNQGLIQWYDDSASSLLSIMTFQPNGNVIVPNGNVGIGTTSPDAHLHVKASSDAHLLIESDNTMSFYQDAGWSSTMMFGAKWNGTNQVYGATTRGAFKMVALHDADNSPQYLAIYGANHGTAGGTVTWNTVGFAQDEDGQVGIGTTSPSAKLHVVGNGEFYSGIGANDDVRTGITHYDTTAQAAGVGGQLVLGYKYHDNGSYTEGAILKMYKLNSTSGDYSSGLKFQVRESGAALSSKMVLDPSGNVGIGTTSPASKLDVNGDIALKGTSVFNLNSAALTIGDIAGTDSVTNLTLTTAGGSTEVFLDDSGNVGVNTTTPSYNLTVDSGTNDIGILTASSDSGSYVGFLDNSTSVIPKIGAVGNKLILDASQYVGIKRTDPSYALDVSGTIRATGDVIAYSDARVKENVETIPNALDKVKAMRGVGYNKIGEEKRSIGVIAQEMLEVMPEAVHQDEQGMYSVAYGNLVGVLIEAVKDLESKVEQLQNKIDGITK